MLRALLLFSFFAAPDSSGVFESQRSPNDFELTADPTAPQWRSVPALKLANDYFGKPIEGPPTEVRSRWTNTHLYLLYVCPYTELNLKPNPTTSAETNKLWDWDVAEAFLGSQADPVNRYKEWEISPQGEWVDLDIDRDHPKEQAGIKWDSGFGAKSRIDEAKKIWYGEMRIPFKSFDTQPPEKGRSFRAGIYRIAGKGTGSSRTHYSWRVTGQPSFHVPQSFGLLRLR